MLNAETGTKPDEHVIFDSAGVGVVANAQWTDSDSLAGIGASVKRIAAESVAVDLPGTGGSGPEELRAAAKQFTQGMSMVILEYSDAFATLGSGVETARENFDATEQYNRERAARLGVEWNK
ncbi:MAG: hypothetical protein ACFN4L_03820 [Pauljensenia sp.]